MQVVPATRYPIPFRAVLERLEPRLCLAAFQGLQLRAMAVSPIEVQLSWVASPSFEAAVPAELAPSSERIRPTVNSNASIETTGFTIERSTGAGYTTIAQTPPDTFQYSDLGLLSNTIYSYRVRATSASLGQVVASARTKKYNAGLSSSFLSPSAVTGTTRSILSYGATANNSSNDDSAAIKLAIAASSPGDEVYIPNGVYHLKTRDIKLKTGVSIRGQSMTGAILSAVFSDQGVDNPSSQMFRAEAGVNNLTLSNFRIEMSGGQSMQYGFYLGSGSATAANVSRIAVKNVNVEGFEKMAVAIRNGDNILVQSSLLRNATALGGGGEGYGVMIGYDNSRNIWVNDNTIGPMIRHAVVVQYRAHHNLIENNTAIDNTEDAYDLHGEDEYSNELRYNVAYGGDGFGFGVGNTGSTHVDSGPNNWIHHNEVYNSRGGVNVILGSDDQFVEDNNFHNNIEEGIKVNNGGGANLWFLRNTVRFNGSGIRLDDAIDPVLLDNIVTDNTGSALRVGATTTGYTIFRNDLRRNGAAVQLTSLDGIFADNLL